MHRPMHHVARGIYRSQAPPTALVARRRRNLFIDGDMSAPDVSAWPATNGVTSKQPGGGSLGPQVLRVAGVTGGYTRQVVTAVGGIYLLAGLWRGDGVVYPTILDGGGPLIVQGTSSAAWARFWKVYTAVTTSPYMFEVGNGFAEYSDLILMRIG